MRYDRTVIGYHGCQASTAQRLLRGERFRASQNDYDWLGHGIYFWEFGADRAMRFIEQKLQRAGSRAKPAVVGAVIQLGECFDLLDTRYTRQLHKAYAPFAAHYEEVGIPLPKNSGGTSDKLVRRLDCDLINWYMAALEEEELRYQTVRGCFVEGLPAYPDAGIRQESHIQVAVRDPACILGVFFPT